MANPVLTSKFDERRNRRRTVDTQRLPGDLDSPIVDEMTFGGSVRATVTLLGITLVGALIGWITTESDAFAGWILPVALGALVIAIATTFRPHWARVTGPIYAVAEGAVLGAITHVMEAEFEGIALQALLATGATFVVMLVLWATRTIRVTDRLRSVIVGATLAILGFYLLSLVLALFGVEAPLVWDTGPIGILFSAVVVGVAAFNLLLDFDLIEKGVESRAPAYMDWYAAFGLLVTIVWLYLEILRLISKVRSD